MAQFKDVFSTTAKVLGALVIISVVVGLGFLFLGGLGSALAPAVSNSPARDAKPVEKDAEDSLRTAMPRSVWDRGVARAVKHHCYVPGMNQEEVVRALGEPTQKSDMGDHGSDWMWKLPPGKCVKYDGDKCVEQETKEGRVSFTPSGNVNYAVDACETIGGDFAYLSLAEVFGKGN
jgi:hypothetical protein